MLRGLWVKSVVMMLNVKTWVGDAETTVSFTVDAWLFFLCEMMCILQDIVQFLRQSTVAQNDYSCT